MTERRHFAPIVLGRHSIDEVGIPRRDYIRFPVWFFLQSLNDSFQLIYLTAIGSRSSSSHPSINSDEISSRLYEIAILAFGFYLRYEIFLTHVFFRLVFQTMFVVSFPCPFVSDVNIVIDKIFYIRISFEEPDEFMEYSPEKHFLGRQQGESFAQIESDLTSEDGTDERRLFSVLLVFCKHLRREKHFLVRSVFHDIFQKIKVLILWMFHGDAAKNIKGFFRLILYRFYRGIQLILFRIAIFLGLGIKIINYVLTN